jgi:hypothetical protein
VPLADFAAADQAGALQGRQVGGHRGLRQTATLIDLPGADAVLVVVDLVGEFDGRVFEPVQDFSPYWVCQGFYSSRLMVMMSLVMSKTLYRDGANFKSLFNDIQIRFSSDSLVIRYIEL